MKISHYFSIIGLFIAVMATSFIFPDTTPQPFDIHPVADRQCNSCHQNN